MHCKIHSYGAQAASCSQLTASDKVTLQTFYIQWTRKEEGKDKAGSPQEGHAQHQGHLNRRGGPRVHPEPFTHIPGAPHLCLSSCCFAVNPVCLGCMRSCAVWKLAILHHKHGCMQVARHSVAGFKLKAVSVQAERRDMVQEQGSQCSL